MFRVTLTRSHLHHRAFHGRQPAHVSALALLGSIGLGQVPPS